MLEPAVLGSGVLQIRARERAGDHCKKWDEHFTTDVGDPMYTGTTANLGAIDLPSDGAALSARFAGAAG